jgi:hypothetical protein
MYPDSHLEQAVLLQDVHELEHASQALASFKKVPVSHAEQAVSVQVLHLSLHAAQVVVVTVPAGATDLKPLLQAVQPPVFVHPSHPASHGEQAVPSSMWVARQVVQTLPEVHTEQPSEQASQAVPTIACKVLHAVQVVVVVVVSYVQVLHESTQAIQVRAVII